MATPIGAMSASSSPFMFALAFALIQWKWIYEPLLAFSIALLAPRTVPFANAYQMT